MATRFEKRYCDDCMSTHWLETVRQPTGWQEICHGENYVPKDSPTHYTRWVSGGIEIIEKKSPAQLPIEWQLAEERENVEYIQDW